MSHFSSFGWSHGGGATWAISETLTNLSTGLLGDLPATFTIDATAYIDAVAYVPWELLPGIGVIHEGFQFWPEPRRPAGAVLHANWYQSSFEPFLGIRTTQDGFADIEQDLTDVIIPPGRRHIDIVDKVYELDLLYDFFLAAASQR